MLWVLAAGYTVFVVNTAAILHVAPGELHNKYRFRKPCTKNLLDAQNIHVSVCKRGQA